jgi:hypothetical protein
MPQNPNLVCELGAEWVGEKPRKNKTNCAAIFPFRCKNINLTIICCKTAKFRVQARGDFRCRLKPRLKNFSNAMKN